MPYPTNINPKDIVEVEILPQNRDFFGIFVYKVPENTPLAIPSASSQGATRLPEISKNTQGLAATRSITRWTVTS
ncbi:MAG: hypothetical protein PUP92_26330 [Rhizonema sp. PD38]|nr:hypothetical protein [Rhizonema sp. PD38]